MRDIYIFHNMSTKTYIIQLGHDYNNRKDFHNQDEVLSYFKKDENMKNFLERGKIRFIIDAHNPLERDTLEEKIRSMHIKRSVIEYYSGENLEKLQRYRQRKDF